MHIYRIKVSYMKLRIYFKIRNGNFRNFYKIDKPTNEYAKNFL